MAFKNIYFFVDKVNEINLDQVKKIGAILILGKQREINNKKLKKFVKNCKSKKISFFVANNLKLLFLFTNTKKTSLNE